VPILQLSTPYIDPVASNSPPQNFTIYTSGISMLSVLTTAIQDNGLQLYRTSYRKDVSTSNSMIGFLSNSCCAFCFTSRKR